MNIQELEKLNELKEKGIITEEEFNTKKKEFLSAGITASQTTTSANRNIFNSYLDCIKKYAQFKGRSSRYEFWSFILVTVIINLVLSVLDAILGTVSLLYGLYSLAMFVPSLAVQARRLHDVNKSGWWILFPYGVVIITSMMAAISHYTSGQSGVALLGLLLNLVAVGLIIYWLAQKGDEKDNKYGSPVK